MAGGQLALLELPMLSSRMMVDAFARVSSLDISLTSKLAYPLTVR